MATGESAHHFEMCLHFVVGNAMLTSFGGQCLRFVLVDGGTVATSNTTHRELLNFDFRIFLAERIANERDLCISRT